ncbi:hypothetical protein [Actinoallomurus iriomotensis]|uniref:hypothetical protein n=1 Tax=Actinoallomurus iriomotensis TaxID=478107 RepID=UPI0025568E45|nr:hypothetical protein [Actinoallomurus iriomotensis]
MFLDGAGRPPPRTGGPGAWRRRRLRPTAKGEALIERVAHGPPLERLASPSEIAEVVVFLAGQAAGVRRRRLGLTGAVFSRPARSG